MIHSSGLMGIGFSLFVVTIAALNLVFDFDFIEKGSTMGAPKYMEWFAALWAHCDTCLAIYRNIETAVQISKPTVI